MAEFRAYREQVHPEWLDYNGHLNDSSYAVVLTRAHELLLEHLGLSAAYRESHQASMFTVEMQLTYVAEVTEGQTLTAATLVVDADHKRLRLRSELFADDVLAATGECLYLHVDTAAGRTAPLPADRQAAVDAMREAHAARVTTPNEGRSAQEWDDSAPIAAPLRLHETTAPPEWMDYNDHMSESCFLLAFGDSADVFFRFIGIDEAYRAAGHSLYTSQTHLHHRQEVALGEPLVMTLQLLDHDRRRLHLYHEMRHGETDELIAMAEQLLVHVDMEAGRSSDLPDDLYAHVAAIHRAHADLPRPAVVGHPIAIRHSK
ncbi:MAG: thioesterase family protein [Nocardioides sp.]